MINIEMSRHNGINQIKITQLQITANKMQHFIYLFIFTDAVHVSGGSSAHHQEHTTVHTASGTASVKINK
jgi:hypothetical protein